jgi:hypothetical protein
VRHLGKGSSSNPLHRGAGSIGIIAAARTGLIIAPHPENHHQRILATTKNNLSKPASDLIYQVVENTQGQPHIQWLGESQFAPSAVFNTGSPMSIARQNILRVLRESDTSLGPLKIADRTGLDYAKVRKLLSSMSSERKIISLSRGLYTTPQHPCLTTKSEPQSHVTTEQTVQVSQTEHSEQTVQMEHSVQVSQTEQTVQVSQTEHSEHSEQTSQSV